MLIPVLLYNSNSYSFNLVQKNKQHWVKHTAQVLRILLLSNISKTQANFYKRQTNNSASSSYITGVSLGEFCQGEAHSVV